MSEHNVVCASDRGGTYRNNNNVVTVNSNKFEMSTALLYTAFALIDYVVYESITSEFYVYTDGGSKVGVSRGPGGHPTHG